MAQLSATRQICVALNMVRSLTSQMVESGQQSLNFLGRHGAELRWNREEQQRGHWLLTARCKQDAEELFRSGNADRNKTPLGHAEALNQYIRSSFAPKQFE